MQIEIAKKKSFCGQSFNLMSLASGMESTKENNNVVITSDGIPLKKKLAKSLLQNRLRAFGNGLFFNFM